MQRSRAALAPNGWRSSGAAPPRLHFRVACAYLPATGSRVFPGLTAYFRRRPRARRHRPPAPSAISRSWAVTGDHRPTRGPHARPRSHLALAAAAAAAAGLLASACGTAAGQAGSQAASPRAADAPAGGSAAAGSAAAGSAAAGSAAAGSAAAGSAAAGSAARGGSAAARPRRASRRGPWPGRSSASTPVTMAVMALTSATSTT